MRYLSPFLISIFTFCLWVASINSVMATHFSGANITYECLSGCDYRIYVKEYYSCGGAPIGPNPTGTVLITPASGCSTPTATTGWVNVSLSEVTPICPANFSMTNCNGGSAINGIMEVVNYRDYDFCSAPCPSYTVDYGTCCRNNSMVNIVPSGGYDVLVSTVIYPNGTCNTSPEFMDPSPIYLESGTAARVSVAAYDVDGDSLAYEITNCSETSGAIPFAPGYTIWQPLGSSWNIDITEGTGDILFAPNPGNVGSYLLCVKVSEYRNGVLLGTHINDFIVYSLASSSATNDPPYIPGVGANVPPVTGGSYIDSFIVGATVNTPLGIPIHAFDANMDSVVMTWSGNIPGATFTKVGNSAIVDTIEDVDPQGLFFWIPTSPGRYSFTVDLEDPGCYVTGNSEYTYVVEVNTVCAVTVDLGPDIQICDGDMALLNSTVSGATPPITYVWSTGETTPSINVNLAGIYSLMVVDSLGCSAIDSIEVIVLPTPGANAGNDSTICSGDAIQLNGSATASPVVYQWIPATNLNNPNIANPVFSSPLQSSTAAHTFQLTVTDVNGCSDDDIVIITALAGASFTLSSNDTICSADTALVSYTGPSGLNYTWDFDGGTVVSGSGSGPYQISWSGAGYGTKYIFLSVGNGQCTYEDSIPVYVNPNCVWPGDADYDGVADNNDLLALGLAYGSTGPARLNASLNWMAQPATPWNDTIPGGINEVHSDTDGNGVVNDDDTLAIVQNYGQTHNKTTEEGGPGDPPLLLLPMVDSSLVGDTVSLAIVLGVDTLPADNVYGIAFTITYDNTLIDSASAKVNFSSSWLGNIGNNMISVQKDMFNDGEIDVAVTRTDQMSMTGFGNLGYFSIVMVDDISGKNNISEILNLDITNVRVITNKGEIVLVYPQPTQIVVTETSTGLDDWGMLSGVKVYPNPTMGVFSIEVEEAQELDIEIYNLQGQKIYARKSHETMTQLDLSNQSRGMYLISISSETRRWTGKIQISR